jgi:formate/nitrite transporter FocA (FNT family)
MFVMPTAILLGADITVGQWLFWNQIPVTLGNIVGGAVLTGLVLHYVNKSAPYPAVTEEKPVTGATRTAP